MVSPASTGILKQSKEEALCIIYKQKSYFWSLLSLFRELSVMHIVLKLVLQLF